MAITGMIWGQWQHLDFFNHRVRIEIIARQIRNTFILNIAAEVAVINADGFRDYLRFGPEATDTLSFAFWAGDTQGGLHQPRVRFRAVAPNSVLFDWIVTDRVLRRSERLIGGETQVAGAGDVHFRPGNF